MSLEHQPVLLNEVIEGLAIKPDGIYVDATFGRGGHSREILNRLGPEGRLIGFDKDPAAVKAAQTGSFDDPRFTIVHGSFSELQNEIVKRGLMLKVDGILMDLGVSSPQLDNPERGFSFTKDGPLDMRMNSEQSKDAASWINKAKLSEITYVLKEYGEERFAKRIATAIVAARETQPIETTQRLAEIIKTAHPAWEKNKHPATRSFQAIRIFVNDELQDLQDGLKQCLEVMSVGGRMCVISFHSLEDRIVKNFIQNNSQVDRYPPRLPIKEKDIQRRLKKVGKLIKPTEQELQQNRRARSARLRIAEKLA